MAIKLCARGRLFEGHADLSATVDLLGSYELIYSYCLEIAGKAHDIYPAELRSRLTIANIESGSLIFDLLTDVAGAIAPLTPDICQYAWDVFKYSYEFITIATDFFTRNNRAMSIHIEINNSPNAHTTIFPPIISNNGSHVRIHPDVLSCAQKHHKNYNNLASLIKNSQAREIEISSDDDHVIFSSENQNKFDVKSITVQDDNTTQFYCNIYRLNVKSLNGYLEYNDEQGNAVIRPFNVPEEILPACIEALRFDLVEVIAVPENQ
ncbi:hypothetical protein [Desulfovulcanus sp.]